MKVDNDFCNALNQGNNINRQNIKVKSIKLIEKCKNILF